MTNPFDNPAAAEGIKFEPLTGSLLMIEPSESGRCKTVFDKGDTDSPYVTATIHVIDGAQAGTVIESTRVFPGILVSQLSPKIGRRVLGRLSQGEAKANQSPPWKLLDATDADVSMGMAYLNARSLGAPATVPADVTATQTAGTVPAEGDIRPPWLR